MNDNEKQFEDFIHGIEFDDSPDYSHRDKLETNLLAELARQSRLEEEPLKTWKIIVGSRITKLTIAAMIILSISIFMIHQGPGEKVDTFGVPRVAKSPAEMLTAMSLMRAYRRGGIEAIERQCEQAIEKLDPRPTETTIKELLAKSNGT